MECNIKETLKHCNCTYEPCSKKGKCCECITFHLSMNELPACCFPDDVEKTYDRSFARFVKIHQR
ncbi:hypothetical protein KAS56_00840 [candidate division WOR-3 bacterium]|nr:hypothetical protein [candidate division WOR-3 bacterium]